MNNKIAYNESVIPHSLVCIDGGSSAINLPTGYIGYDFDIPNDFSGSTSALDLYLHALEINGTIYFYPPAVTNPTTPVLTSGNQLVIQSFINSCLVSEGFSANDLIFIVNGDNTITIWTSPTYLIAGSEFWMGVSSPDNYTNKYFPVIPTIYNYPVGKMQAQLVKHRLATGQIIDKFYTIGLNPIEIILSGSENVTPGECCKPTIQYFQKFYYDSTLDECTPIKETITTLCDGTQTYQYIMEDGAGGFTDATTTIVGWDESNVFIQSCVQQQSINNSPITTLVNNNSTFTITTDFFSVSYVVIGSGATIETPHNSFTRNLFDGESGEFRADDGKTLDNTIIFTTTTNSKIIINAIIRI